VTEPTRFPPDFLWGAATSAYQVEGAPLADGAGPSIWHEFSHRPGAILHGHTGDVACDHYHRYPEDIALMRALNLNAYRFSFAWPRILPAGRGAVNPAGLGFYDRLIDGLLEAGLRPFATLYHWDLPAALEEQGGWLHDDVAGWFADFAALLARHFGDRVTDWTTLNEPGIVTEKGYVLGIYAPGHRNPAEAPVVARNLMRAHGAAVRALRAGSRGQVGVVVNLQPKHPASDSEADRDAAARADAFRNRQFLDAMLLGQTPPELPAMFGPAWRPLSPDDLALIHQPLDFVGINYYTRNVIRDDPANPPTRARLVAQPDRPHTLMGWEVYPEGLAETLRWVAGRYGPVPLYVTENGAAFDDPAPAAGADLEDPARVDFLRGHLEAALRARAAGVDLRGYFVWSLLDNFEWSSGYARPFGLVHVDFGTQRRTVKRSGRFFAGPARAIQV
jgi:beta-glucosidase